MLEKIGLPPKPSMRGASWVVDATHCQGCSAQFSMFTRKHHCQRCGGLFCSSCTQQRMVLRGQGDSPVRICDPCKKLEDEARYELRYGHKNRASKVNSKAASTPEDEILSEILGADGKQTKFSRRESLDSALPGRTVSAAIASSSSSSQRRTAGAFSMDGNGDGSLSIEGQKYELNNTGSVFTPEELRQHAVEEKKRYKTLKSEGKPEEALRAFKHGKELERQAAALEIELRKSRRMSTKVPTVSAVVSTKNIDNSDVVETKKTLAGKSVRKEKNDLASELRDLGWADADLNDETRTTAMSVEGELSQILREVAPKSSEGKKTSSIGKSQVIALKRQALLLKREGKLAEAKEELKKAKILERQLEEQEILGEADESDDDLAAIIRNMDDDNQDDLLLDNPKFPAINFEQMLGASDDLAIDGNFDVTDDDINDPDMAAALKSFGWSEEDDNQMEIHGPVSLDKEALKEQVLTLKREAVAHKKAGNVAEAMQLLKQAKLLEKDLESEQPDSNVSSLEGHRSTHTEDATTSEMNARPVPASKSKLSIQRELLALKKKALALRREGKVDEAEEELKKGSVLEKQLEELEIVSKKPATKENRSIGSTPPYKVDPSSLDLADEGYEPEVTDNDMHDPALLSVLKNMGWEDDGTDSVSNKPLNPLPVAAQKPTKSKGQIQKELLAVKRKALAFRREGRNTEAEEELEKAKVLEQHLSEMEELGSLGASQQGASAAGQQTRENKSDAQHVPGINASAQPSALSNTMKGGVLLPVHGAELAPMDSSPSIPHTKPIIAQPDHAPKNHIDGTISALSRQTSTDPFGTAEGSHSPSNVQHHKEAQKAHGEGDDTLKDEILFHKRKAVAFKREGKLAEAREELKLAKLIEKRLEGAQQNSADGRDDSTAYVVQQSNLSQQFTSASSHTDDFTDSAPPAQENKSIQPPKALSSRDRLKIQRESLGHKRNALKLRREGKTEEADAEFELAKSLESQLEESDSSSGSKSSDANNAIVEDLFDPQMMSALKSIGWSDADLSTQSSMQPLTKAEAKPVIAATSKPQSERTQLEEQIKAEKMKALNFKRGGKQAEAMDALRSAKRLEKKLASLS